MSCTAGERLDVPVRRDDGELQRRRQPHEHLDETFTVTVVDTTAPVVTVPANATMKRPARPARRSVTATAIDNIDGARAVTCTPPSGSTFPATTTTVTCSATDSHANTGTKTFTVTVRDTTAPVVTVPTNATIEAAAAAGAPFTFTATAADLLDGAIAVGCTPSSGSIFPLGTTTVTCTATDAHANSAGKTFTVTVVDTTGPVISVPANMTVEAPGPAGVAVSYVVTAIDAVNGVVTPTCTPASGATFPLDTTTVNCSATDARSNTRSASFTVTVVNASKPIVAVTAPANAATVSGASVTVSATASHPLGIAGVQFKVDGISIGAEDTTAPYSVVWNSTTAPNGTHTLTAIARDSGGGTNTASVAVTVTNAPGTVDLAVDGNRVERSPGSWSTRTRRRGTTVS